MLANIAQRNARRMAASIQRVAAPAMISRVSPVSAKVSSPLSIRSALRSIHTEKPPARTVFSPLDTFVRRHNGPNQSEVKEMLSAIGLKDLDALTGKTIPDRIRSIRPLALDHGFTEKEVLERLKHIASKNKVYKNYIGMGYTDTVVPNVILRNVLENPGWYTQYTPYQPEIAQGRLESLLNYQTMITDLTGMSIANASLLDEGTAAAEAMLMCWSSTNRKKSTFFIDENCHPQTIACMQTRAEAFNIKIIIGNHRDFDFESVKNEMAGVIIQYPDTRGNVSDYKGFADKIHGYGAQVVAATDLMALTMLTPPGEWGADIALGNSQRFGVPLGYGGPHAAFFACKDEHKRRMPGRLVGVSKDAQGNQAYRLALQTREQHIRREKATSNICTAQALLANMAALYAVYHGPAGIKEIAQRIHNMTTIFAEAVRETGHKVENEQFFDTLTIKVNGGADSLVKKALAAGINVRQFDAETIGVTFDESCNKAELDELIKVFTKDGASTPDLLSIAQKLNISESSPANVLDDKFVRTSDYLTHKIFNSYHSETEMLRYIYRLQNKDLSLTHSMIPLGSCTMKLNATTEMIPVTWPELGNIHPFAPDNQTEGYQIMLKELRRDLAEITGFDDVSLQPNSGAQGEYAGLRTIRAYHEGRGDTKRNVCLIPVSAHGTNPASAAMAGMDVVAIKCLANGNLDLEDLKAKATKYSDRLSTFMVTYPSTFGVFEDTVSEACEIIHSNGGQVYMDGANMNAQIGLTSPGHIGADVCHLNLHKTFCIPHGGGGPGMGPIGVKTHLAPYLPGHPVIATGGEKAIGPISAAPHGSASILPISWAYVKMMGGEGIKNATEIALLNANYMAHRLGKHYKVLFTNENGMCAHEFIIDIRPFGSVGVEAIDIAKRLQDYGFHSPTMSWPVPNTLMIEPTESESKEELDRFCDAMIAIREEIQEVQDGKQPQKDNVLNNAPHTLAVLMKDDEFWKSKSYTRLQAAYPLPYLQRFKLFPTISRIDDSYGDRNLMCSCPPMSDYDASVIDADEFDQAFGSEIGSVENTLLVNVGGNYLLSDQDIDLLLYSDDTVGPDIDYNNDAYTTGDLMGLEGDTDSNELLEDLLDNQLQKHFLPGSEGSFYDVFNNCDREQDVGIDHILTLNNEEALLSIISSDWALLEDNKTLDPGSNSDSLYRDLIDISMQQRQGIQTLKRTRQQHLGHEALGNYSEKFMETRVQSREWVLQNLEEIASRFMEDLSLQVAPRIELASRELPKAIIYDEETGVIRRRQDLFPNQEHDTAEGSKRRKRGSFPKYGSTCAEREKTMGRTDAAPYTKTYDYGTRQTAQVNSILRAAQLVHENVYNGTVSTKRDLFYRDVTTFGSQPAVDRIVEDLACTLQVPRPCLNVVAGARSVVYGSIRMTIRIQGKKNKEVSKDPAWLQDELSKPSSFRAPTHPSSHGEERKRVDEDDPLDKKVSRTDYNTLVMVPATMDDILQIEIHSKTRFILVVEKEATMNHLISLGFSESHGPCILITSKGFPDRVARELLKILSDMIQAGVFTLSPTFSLDSCRAFPKPCLPLDIPMLALVDCDPHGISIFLTYRCGSVHSAYDNAKLAVPTLKCIGQVPQDWDIVLKYKQEIVCSIDRYFMQRLQDQLREALIPLTDRDRSMLIKMLTQHPFIRQHRAWTVEISKMLMLNRKSELQSLCLGGYSARNVTLEKSLEKSEKGNRANNLGHAVELPSLVLYLERKLQEPRYWL